MSDSPWRDTMGPTFNDMTGVWPKNDDLCSVCGRPPHPCDDPECIPITAPIYKKLVHCLAEKGFIRADLERLRGVLVAILQTACDADEADPKALLHEIAELCARELPKTPND